MWAKGRFSECYSTTYSDCCALQSYLLSYKTPTCKRERTKLENLKKPKKHENYGQCVMHSKQHTSTIFTMIHIISLPSRSELSPSSITADDRNASLLEHIWFNSIYKGRNYNSFLCFFFFKNYIKVFFVFFLMVISLRTSLECIMFWLYSLSFYWYTAECFNIY
jgi:hypothetical protein